MLCSSCNSELKELFLSTYCPKCTISEYNEDCFGYIVWRNRPAGSCEYVFKDLESATKWRKAAGLERFSIAKVQGKNEFRWRKSTGSVPDIYLADRLYEIFPEKPKEGVNIAWLMYNP